MPRIQNKRGLFANLPTSGMLAGEIFHTTDRGAVFVALDPTTKLPVIVPVDQLAAIGAVDGAADYLMIHDGSATGVKEKKISFDDLKTALNIPAGSSDEQVAVVSGGTSGFIWGTDGTDGIFRMNASMAWSKDAGNEFVTLSVGDVDCGTF